MRITPLTLRQANDLVRQWHRHHAPVISHRFSLGVLEHDKLHGAVIVGRPTAKVYDHYAAAEVRRLVTDGTQNACSFLYAAAARVAREMGFSRIQTYILEDEPGTSLKAAGWTYEATTPGGQWVHNFTTQLRLDSGHTNRDDQPTSPKQRWAKVF